MTKVHDQASKTAAESGEVQVDGPDGVAVSLTPDAALTTADRLTDAAGEAQGQRLTKERDDSKKRD
jgi:hypothetical protein